MDELHQIAENIINETSKAITGKNSEIKLLLTALLSGGNVLIEDVPGVGKTTLSSAFAEAAGLKFGRVQFTPDVLASDITGYSIYNRVTGSFEFREGAVMCNVLLADEINRASPKTQSALLEAMEEKKVTVDGVTYLLPEPFTVIATQNPSGFIGTYPLPEAQLDRFAIKLSLGYPNGAQELEIVMARLKDDPRALIRPAADANTILALRKAVSEVYVSPDVGAYIISLIAATRANPAVSLGASPRASLALTKAAQARAYLRESDFVSTEDAAAMLRPCVTHRIVLRRQPGDAHKTADDVMSEILRETSVPYAAKSDKRS